MLAAVIDSSPDLSARIQGLVGPFRDEREAIRDRLLGEESEDEMRIVALPTETAYSAVGACDGGSVVSTLALGEHLATLSVAVRSTPDGDMAITGHRSWSDFLTHEGGDAAALLTEAMMLSGELALLPTLDDTRTVAVIDGSHVTPLIAINLALASNDSRVRAEMVALVDEGLVDWVRYAVDTPTVVACPKFDSSTDLWDRFRHLMPHLRGNGLPDKVLASMLLEPGEMLVSRRDSAIASWRYLYDTLGRVSDPETQAVRRDLAAAVEPLRSAPYIRVFHAKPEGAATAIRVEVKPVDDFDTYDMIAAVANDCAPPFLQEPVAQHLADTLAKTVSSAADFQMERTRLDLAEAGDTALLDFLLRHYRTT